MNQWTMTVSSVSWTAHPPLKICAWSSYVKTLFIHLHRKLNIETGQKKGLVLKQAIKTFDSKVFDRNIKVKYKLIVI